MKKNNFIAFTLVELIVVITILAVLTTVAFVSFQGYASSGRDSVRLADLKNISKSLELKKTQSQLLPLPGKKVDISSSGTIFQHQGELSLSILQAELSIYDGGVDPSTQLPYGYAVNATRNQYQLIGFLENPETFSYFGNSYIFADNSDKYIKTRGDELGIMLDTTNNEVINADTSSNQIDIQTNTTDYTLVMGDFIYNNGYEEIANQLSYRVNFQESCRAIKFAGNDSGDGKYMINPSGVSGQEFEVYCDMTTDGGGWTILGYANGEDETHYGYNKIVNWVPTNSDTCGEGIECLSQAGVDVSQWNDLLLYSNGYKIKGTYCNDRNLAIYDYTQLSNTRSTTTTRDSSIGSCDEIKEVSLGKKVSSHASDNASAWMIDMGVMRNGNEGGEFSVLGFGPGVAPLGLGNKRGDVTYKIGNVYQGNPTTEYTMLHNPWDAASPKEQTWFIR